MSSTTPRILTRRVAVNPVAKPVLDSIHRSGNSDNTKSIAVEANLSTTDGPKKLAAAASEAFGRVDILANNAAELSQADLERAWDWIVNLNGRGTMPPPRTIVPLLSSSSPSPVVTGQGRGGRSKGMVESFTG
ncbi:hypothetical protein F4809DRAFT_644067 [Biscogniauxia mediterranea]|nr:hypothetical protein F4809DRAFT_644067 [Biscogniauxia mediterranea]